MVTTGAIPKSLTALINIMETIKDTCGWFGKDVYSLTLRGSGKFVKQMVEKLDYEFNAPYFGYNYEEWDEYE